MSVYSLFVYGSATFLTANDSNQAGALVLRDSSGNANAAGFTAGVLGVTNMTGPVYIGGTATKTTTYSVGAADDVVPYDPTSGAFAITLPPIAVSAGRLLTFVNVGTSTTAMTLTGNGAELINAANTKACTTANQVTRVWGMPDASKWLVL